MNENEDIELLDLEAELSALRPVAVESGLLAKVNADLLSSVSGSSALTATEEARSNVIKGFFARYGQLAAAAMLVLSSGLLYFVNSDDEASSVGLVASETPTAATVVNGDGFQRVGSSSQVTAHGDSKVIVKDGRPYRVQQFDFQEEQQWTKPSEGTEVKVKRPRTEQMLIPLNVY